MDKSDNTYTYQPQRSNFYNRMSPSAPISTERSYGENANSFEAALGRIRDQTEAHEVEPGPEVEVESVDSKDDEELELDSEDELEPGLQQTAERPVSGNTEALSSIRWKTAGIDNLLEDGLADFAGISAEGHLSGDAAVVSSPVSTGSTQTVAASGTNLQGPLTAESVASLMLRMERTAGAHSGQWSFGVLGNQAGVTALQLQRSAQGGWRVRVSFDDIGQIDEKMHAEALKASLIESGHRVDSITFASTNDELALND